MSESSKSLSTPGFWPGMLELLYFVLLVGLAVVAAEEFDGRRMQEGAILHTGAASILTTIVYLIVGRRHRKRAGVEGNGPFYRVRDLAVLTSAATMAPLIGSQFASAKSMSGVPGMGDSAETMLIATVFLAVLNLFFTSKIWGALTGPRSVVWGVLAFLGGAVAAVSALMLATSDVMSAFGVGGYLLAASQFLVGLAYVLGGLAMFKEPAERVSAAANASALLGGAWGIFAAGDLYLLGTLLTAKKSDMEAMMGAPIVPSTLLFVLVTFGALRHAASLKAAVPPTPAGA